MNQSAFFKFRLLCIKAFKHIINNISPILTQPFPRVIHTKVSLLSKEFQTERLTSKPTSFKMVLNAIIYSPEKGTLSILDQLLLPHQELYIPITSAEDGWHAIKNMQTRGAPAIAIVAALSLAVELRHPSSSSDASKLDSSSSAQAVADFVTQKLDYLVTSRPTAVNLADAAGKLKKIVRAAAASEGASAEGVREKYCEAAAEMLVADVSDNEGIGKFGAEWIEKVAGVGSGGKVSVLTHCNTG